MADNKQIKYTAGLDPSGFLAGSGAIGAALNSVEARAKAVATGMQGAADSITSKWTGLQGMVLGLAASFGVISFAHMVKGAIDGAARLHDLSKVTGMTVESLSALGSVGKLSETSLESIASASNKLSKNMAGADEKSAGAAQAIKSLNLNLDEFKALAPEERFQAVAKALADFSDTGTSGASKTAVAMALLGKEGAQMLPFMADLAKVGALQARVTTEQAAAADNFQDNLVKLKASGEGWKKELAFGMLPALNEVSTAVLGLFNGTGGLREQIRQLSADGTLAEWTRTGITGVSYLIDGVQYLIRIFKSAGEIIANWVARWATTMGGLAEAFGKWQRFDFSGAIDSLRAMDRMTDTMAKEGEERLAAIWGEETLGAQLRARMAELKGISAIEPTKPRAALNFQAKSDKDKKADPSQMGDFDLALAQVKEYYAKQDPLREDAKQKELEYWRVILENTGLVAKDRVAIQKKVADLEVQILRDKAKEAQQLGRIELEQWRDTELARIALAEDAARTAAEIGQATAEQLLAQEEQFEQKRHAIKRAALDMSLANIDPERDPVKRAELNAQIEALEQAHQLKLQQIRGQVAKASAAEQRAIWDDLGSRMSKLWDDGINAMMNGTLRWSNAMRAVGAELVGWMAGMVKRQVATWVFGENAKSAATQAGTLQRWAMESWAATKSVALWAATAVKNIMVSAWEAMAGAWKAIVGIPYVGPILAPIAAAAAFAGVSSLARNVLSAEGGFDIPRGANPMVQLHEQEMVLPARHANVIRDLAEGDGGGGRSGAVTVELKAHPMPGNYFMVHRDQLVAAIKSARRDFALSG